VSPNVLACDCCAAAIFQCFARHERLGGPIPLTGQGTAVTRCTHSRARVESERSADAGGVVQVEHCPDCGMVREVEIHGFSYRYGPWAPPAPDVLKH
jgi:hypothetical protein